MIIKVKNLRKTYPGEVPTPALKGLTFDIKAGEFVAITGKSGSGKSTLLHQLGLIDSPTEGEIHIGDINVTTLTDREKTAFRLSQLGYVFQEYALITELTARENVWMPALVLGKDPTHCWDHAARLLDQVDLGGRLDHYPNELSGGEQQRVAIARALINSPKILFADEPTANLDSASSKKVLDIFRKLNKEEGLTILMVTHESDYAKLARRNIELLDGLIIKDDKF